MKIIKDGKYLPQTYASHAFDHWGTPSNAECHIVENFEDVINKKDAQLIDASEPVKENFDEYCDMIENTMWIFNNETMKIKEGDVYIVGSGINWMFQKGNVNIYDISKVQIQFIESLLKNWNGENYGKFVYDFLQQNKIRHFHVNLNEKQESNKILVNNKENFIEKINENFALLKERYCPDWQWKQANYTVKNKSIIDEMPHAYLGKFVFTNIFDFKYYFAKLYPQNAYDYLSPSTKAFIKSATKYKNDKIQACKKLDLTVPYQDIYQEIFKIKSYLVPHRSDSGVGWQGFCIHGQSYRRTKEEAHYKNFLGYNWTKEALEHMPKTIAWLKTLGYKEFQRVRVMCLQPKGFINLHKDRDFHQLGPVNVAINHPKDCTFYLENHGVVEFAPGVAYQLDVGNLHCVVNNSNVPRYHIIIHGNR